MLKEPVLWVRGLSKFYRGFRALEDVSFEVNSGWCYGYLGPNGAGKTTTIRIILGLMRADGGEIRVLGADPLAHPIDALGSVGYAPELPNLQNFLTASELLDLVGKMHGLHSRERARRTRELLDLVGLTDHAGKKVGKFSKGMIQRLSVAQSLVNDPQLLIMDEPTLGMDPAATIYFREFFRDLARSGKTIFLSSHVLDEVQRTCTHVGMVHRGRIVFKGPIIDVVERFTRDWVVSVEVREARPDLVERLTKLPFVKDLKVDGNRLSVHLNERRDFRSEIASEIVHARGELLELSLKRASLEDAYLQALKQGS